MFDDVSPFFVACNPTVLQVKYRLWWIEVKKRWLSAEYAAPACKVTFEISQEHRVILAIMFMTMVANNLCNSWVEFPAIRKRNPCYSGGV